MLVKRRNGAVLRQLQTLFNVGTIGELTDGQLLERFATDPDEVAELAFSALVERHGALVWRVCLAILRDEHDAEDAFQATFLVLVRRARSLWVRDSLGPWLHQVACRTASCLRATAIRRRTHEQRRAERDSARSVEAGTPRDPDRDAAVHEEVNRLPEKYRAPIVLCDLEGRTHQEAARFLGWPIGTVKSRQSQGRARLRNRLTRRGLGLAVAGVVVASLRQSVNAAIPKELSRSTVNAAMQQAGRLLTGFVVSAQALALTQRVLRATLWIRLRFLAVVALAVGVASGGAILLVGGSQYLEPKNGQTVSKRSADAQIQPSKTSKEVAIGDRPLLSALDEALKAARAIEDPSARRSALVGIANAQAYLNDLTSARATARLARQSADQMSMEMNKYFGLWSVAKLQAKLGDVESARQTFQRLIQAADGRAPWDRMSLLGQIAIAQDGGGLQADAIQTLNKAIEDAKAIVAKTPTGGIYYNIVFAQCQIGDFDGALRIVESIQGDETRYRQTYLHFIARGCDKAGPAEARRILAKALELSKGIKYISPRGLSQKQIAQAMARNGDIPGALAASKLIGVVEEAPAGLLSFLNARETRMRLENDKVWAAEVRHEVADVLIAIATEQARSGDRPAAKKTFGEAMQLIQAERDGAIKTQRLRVLVEALAGAVELEGAKVAIEAIHGDEANKALALVWLAKAQAKAGNKPGARESLSTAFEAAKEIKALPNMINDNIGRRKDEAFRAIATAQVDLGEIRDALATVSAHDNKALKAEIQAQAAGFQARQGDFAGALKTAESIADAGSKAKALAKIAQAQSRTGQQDVAHDWAAKLSSPQERALTLLGVVEGVFARRRGE